MLYDTINPQIVRIILEEAREGSRIMDVGCGTGRIGQYLKSRLKCSIVGIEVDKEAAGIAKSVYDEIIIMNLEELIDGISKISVPKKFDFVVFGDILEHVSGPEKLLRYFRDCLKDDGFLVASIPNIANWMIRIKLLFGNFDYSGGILDKGHLKFFTYKNAKKLLEENGYSIVEILNNNTFGLFRFLGRYWKSMFAFQFVFKCIKK